jgi:hypothetical protein
MPKGINASPPRHGRHPRKASASLAGHPCPRCRRAPLRLFRRGDWLVNRCGNCAYEVVTEAEWRAHGGQLLS